MPADSTIGSFDEMVELCKVEITRGTVGEKIESFSHVATVFANVMTSTSESPFDDNLESKETATVTLYKRPELTTRWKLRFRGKDWDINAIDPIERISPYMKLTVREV